MTQDTEVIHVDPGSEIDKLLDEVDHESVVLVRRGIHYRLTRESLEAADPDDIWAGYDPERALAGIRAAAGAWSDIDTEEMKEYIYRAREEGSRPPDRPDYDLFGRK